MFNKLNPDPKDEPRALSLEPILAALTHPDQQVRHDAVKALGQTKDPRALEALINALKKGDADMRATAARVLGDFPNPGTSPQWLPMLKSPDPFIRATMARTLGKWGDKNCVQALVGCLTDSEGEVRKVVAKALSRLGERHWMPIILGVPNDFVQLGRFKDPRLLEALVREANSSSPQKRALVAEGLAFYNEALALDAVGKALQDKNPLVRKAVVLGVGKANQKGVAEKLLYLLDDEDENVRTAAMQTLDKLDKSQTG